MVLATLRNSFLIAISINVINIVFTREAIFYIVILININTNLHPVKPLSSTLFHREKPRYGVLRYLLCEFLNNRGLDMHATGKWRKNRLRVQLRDHARLVSRKKLQRIN